MDVDGFIEHHGIKGQRWGIRHKPNPKTGRVGTGFQITEEHKKAHELKRRPIGSLTNQELKTTNERLNLEKNFRRLNPTRVQKGHQLTNNILKAVGVGGVAALAQNKATRNAVIRGAKWVTGPSIKKGLSTIGKH